MNKTTREPVWLQTEQSKRAQRGKQTWTTTGTGDNSEHRGRGEPEWKWELSSARRLYRFSFIHSIVLPAHGVFRPGASTDSSKVHLHVS